MLFRSQDEEEGDEKEEIESDEEQEEQDKELQRAIEESLTLQPAK